jgi:serine/threonine protein phosphatase PrpC
MDFMIAAHTDVGIKKKINQDSVLIKAADTAYGKVCLAVICDGMGGLQKGELASATVIKAFNEWFLYQLPSLITGPLDREVLKKQWEDLIYQQNVRIAEYGNRNGGVRLGTTVVAILLFQNRWYVVNIGDSRVYELSDNIYQVTKDHTFVQQEIDFGYMTQEEALRNPRRSVLLQCVGASEVIQPDFFCGTIHPESIYLLCSDGFRHVVSSREIYQRLNPKFMHNQEIMHRAIIDLVELNKIRQEYDNISAVAIKISE